MAKLGRKQSISNDAWLDTVRDIETIVTLDDLDALEAKTVQEIQEITNGKKAAYAWSGGKDSVVLTKVCEQAGVLDSMIGVCNLEYPAFMAWIADHKPDRCEVINTGQGLEWLSNHPDMLFPQDSTKAAQWFQIVQHKAQREYFRKHELDILVLGRRRADGNYVGRKTNIYTNGQGVTRYSPLADWTHEHILAYIHYHQLTLPPIYGWHNGYLCGTHPWPARQWTENEENGWREVYNIDPNVVITAAELFPGARAYLEVAGK